MFSTSSNAFLPIFLFPRLPLEVNVVGWRAANTLEWVDAYCLQRRLLPLNMASSMSSGEDSTPRDIGLSCPSALHPRASRVDTFWVTCFEMVGGCRLTMVGQEGSRLLTLLTIPFISFAFL